MIQQVEIFDLLQKRLWQQPIRLIELFGGIGSQHKALTRLGVEVSEHYLVEIDADATISYAAIHCDLHSYLNDEVPSKEEMIAYLQPFNWWKNEKSLNLERYAKLKELYLAQRLTNNLGDLNQLDDLPPADMITWSTPCQDFSNAGNKAGFTGHKGSLTHATVELFQKMSHKPTFLLFENVPMIVSETFRDGFDDVFRQIANLGYENILMKLNAKHYGIPQNRDRVFVLSIRKEYDANYSKPKQIDLKLRLKDMLEDEVDASFYLSDIQLQQLQGHDIDAQELSIANPINSMEYDGFKELSPTLKARDYKDPKWVAIPEANQKGYAEAYEGDGVYIDRPHQKRGTVQKGIIQTLSTTPHTDVGVVVVANTDSKHEHSGRVYSDNGLSPTIMSNSHGKTSGGYTSPKVATTQCINSKVNGKQPKVQDRIYDEQGISTAVTTSFMPSVLNQLQIRKLTPRETWRLMGFDDSDFDKASAIHSNSTLYKQAGNSIVVNVLEHILKGLFYESTTI
jgi:DNA (cytosine-5)-methyltransferase 1